MLVFVKHVVGMKVAVDVDAADEFGEANTQIIKRNMDTLNFIANGNRFRYKFYEKGLSKSWEFDGFVILTKTT